MTEDKKVIVIEPRSMSDEDKQLLKEAGFIVVEAEDPTKVVFLKETSFIDTNNLLMSALYGLQLSTSAKERFVEELYKRLKDSEKEKSSNQK